MTVLTILTWTLVLCMGLTFLKFVCPGLRPIERIGFAFPVGTGMATAVMFVLDLIGVPLNIMPLLLGVFLLWIAGFGWLSYRRDGRPDFRAHILLRGMDNPGVDIAYYLVLACIVFLVIVIGAKALLWPVVNYDSVAGYDLLGKIIAAEGTLNNTVYDQINSLESTRTSYPPLYPYTLALAHLSGAVNPKLTNLFFYGPMAVCFYQLLRNYITPLGSAIFTLLLISAPDYADFSSLSSNNTPLAFYAGLGLICMFIWYDKGTRDFYWLGTVLMALGMWDRMEAIFFLAASALIILIRGWKKRKFRDLLVYLGLTILPVVIWQLYMHFVLGGHSKVDIRFYLFWDPERIAIMLEQIGQTSFSTLYWGVVIHASLILAVASLIFTLIRRKRDKWLLFLATVVAWVLYLILYYQMEADFERVGWLLYSYKRGLYSYLPPLIFGLAILSLSRLAFGPTNIFRSRNVESVSA